MYILCIHPLMLLPSPTQCCVPPVLLTADKQLIYVFMHTYAYSSSQIIDSSHTIGDAPGEHGGRIRDRDISLEGSIEGCGVKRFTH
jgi:hypothetical protein